MTAEDFLQEQCKRSGAERTGRNRVGDENFEEDDVSAMVMEDALDRRRGNQCQMQRELE